MIVFLIEYGLEIGVSDWPAVLECIIFSLQHFHERYDIYFADHENVRYYISNALPSHCKNHRCPVDFINLLEVEVPNLIFDISNKICQTIFKYLATVRELQRIVKLIPNPRNAKNFNIVKSGIAHFSTRTNIVTRTERHSLILECLGLLVKFCEHYTLLRKQLAKETKTDSISRNCKEIKEDLNAIDKNLEKQFEELKVGLKILYDYTLFNEASQPEIPTL